MADILLLRLLHISLHNGCESIDRTPSFNPVKVFRKEKSDADKYNNHVSQIHQDITDAYEATINQTTQIMTDFNLIETERNKLSHELANISKSIDELLLVSNNSDYKYFESYVVSFENASDVNKANSTIFVDIQNKEVTLSENIGKGKELLLIQIKRIFKHYSHPRRMKHWKALRMHLMIILIQLGGMLLKQKS